MNEEYWQLMVAPRDGCTGEGLCELLEMVAGHFDCSWCVLSDIDLVGTEGVREELLTLSVEAHARSLDECLKLFRKASQVVWASVFLCRSFGEAKTLRGNEDYIDSLRKCHGLLRAIDGAEYFVYLPAGTSESVLLPGEVHRRRVPIDELTFPE
jgi:hypothetical protein